MKVGLTQSAGRLAELEPLLLQRGYQVLRQPLIETRTLRGVSLEPLEACPWWLFTSLAAVQGVLQLGASLENRKLGAVGEATAKALQQGGGEVLLVCAEASVSSLLGSFMALGEVGPVGLPQGNRALPTLAEGLQKAGYEIRPLVVYQTQAIPWPEAIAFPEITLVASPSALEGLSQGFAHRTLFVAIGSTTAQSLQERGWNFVVPKEMSVQGLLVAIESLAKQGATNAD